MSALEQCRKLFTTDCVIGNFARNGFRSNAMTSKRNWVWGSHFNVCFGIMKTRHSWSISRQEVVQRLFRRPRSSICWISRAQRKHYLRCVLWDTPKPKLKQVHQEQKQELLMEGVVLFHDNARQHFSRITHAKRTKLKWEQLDHALYSPDMLTCYFHVFGPLEKHLKGQRFNSDDELK